MTIVLLGLCLIVESPRWLTRIFVIMTVGVLNINMGKKDTKKNLKLHCRDLVTMTSKIQNSGFVSKKVLAFSYCSCYSLSKLDLQLDSSSFGFSLISLKK